jgi:hypothetical protein
MEIACYLINVHNFYVAIEKINLMKLKKIIFSITMSIITTNANPPGDSWFQNVFTFFLIMKSNFGLL